MTPDGRRVVSASDDNTLKVWDLESHACFFTHRANAGYTAVAATATTIIAGDCRRRRLVSRLAVVESPRALDPRDPWPDNQRSSFPDTEPPSPRPPMKKHTILFLAANPLGTDRLALDREARAIQVELERSGFRDRFELVTRWAAEPLDLLRELRKLKPTVVHFSGHGGPSPAGRATVQRRADDVVAAPAPTAASRDTACSSRAPMAAPSSSRLRRSRRRSARRAPRSSWWSSTPATATCRPRRCLRTSTASWG